MYSEQKKEIALCHLLSYMSIEWKEKKETDVGVKEPIGVEVFQIACEQAIKECVERKIAVTKKSECEV